MNRAYWQKATSAGDAARRAGGRRRYNAQRKKAVHRRLIRLAYALADHPEGSGCLEALVRWNRRPQLPDELLRSLAQRFGIHRATVYRDLHRLRKRILSWEYRGTTDIVTLRLRDRVVLRHRLGGGMVASSRLRNEHATEKSQICPGIGV